MRIRSISPLALVALIVAAVAYHNGGINGWVFALFLLMYFNFKIHFK